MVADLQLEREGGDDVDMSGVLEVIDDGGELQPGSLLSCQVSWALVVRNSNGLQWIEFCDLELLLICKLYTNCIQKYLPHQLFRLVACSTAKWRATKGSLGYLLSSLGDGD